MNLNQIKKPEAVGAAQAQEYIAKQTSLDSNRSNPFLGTNNPRRIRALIALVYRDCVSREDLDKLAGCTNSPDLVAQLKKRCGLDIQTREVKVKDRDGKSTWYGEYSLAIEDKYRVKQWLVSAGHVERAQYGPR